MSAQLCPVCDGPLQANAQFCTNCGYALKNTESTIVVSPAQGQSATAQTSYPPQQGYAQQQGYPPQGYTPPPQAYGAPQQQGYPQQPGYPPQQYGQIQPYQQQPIQQPGYPQQQPYVNIQQQQPYNPYGMPPQNINVVVNTTAQSTVAPVVAPMPVVVVKQKSALLAFLLTFFFGPFGLFYVSFGGALIFLLITFFLTLITAGAFGVLAWIISMIWGPVAASNYNKTIVIR